MAPLFGREAWACVWRMVQNDLVHGWGLDWNFWRCVDDPEAQIGVVDAQFVVHRGVATLLAQGKAEDGGGVRERQWAEFHAFTWRLQDVEEKAH
ncbi:unnamed protein product [Miscanthus lutarioriparius]|uniref:Uncharacterized protein n=1 Tax=Miscanthus lutarioriparius TaxID=422564 RepID=A0A811RZ45_9POAL|nr:unnamed protein product [Miscanthus lutarioriparius]